MLPATTTLHHDDTHRLIPTRYLPGDVSVLSRLAASRRDLDDLAELEGATNDRLIGEVNRLPGISVHELVFGVPNFHIVNASFTHAAPSGSRFNSSDRGAWYAAFALETAHTEVGYHFGEELREIPSWKEPESRTYRDYLADFRADFHDLRGDSGERSFSRSYELCCVAGAGTHASQPRIGGSGVSECEARRGDLCCVFPSGSRNECARGRAGRD